MTDVQIVFKVREPFSRFRSVCICVCVVVVVECDGDGERGGGCDGRSVVKTNLRDDGSDSSKSVSSLITEATLQPEVAPVGRASSPFAQYFCWENSNLVAVGLRYLHKRLDDRLARRALGVSWPRSRRPTASVTISRVDNFIGCRRLTHTHATLALLSSARVIESEPGTRTSFLVASPRRWNRTAGPPRLQSAPEMFFKICFAPARFNEHKKLLVTDMTRR